MATAVFTTVEARVDQALTNAIWEDEIRSNLNQLAGAHRNILTNGGFDVWQRGVGPFTAANAYGPDRWIIASVGVGSIQLDREASIIDARSTYSCKITAVASTTLNISQAIENSERLRSETVSWSVRVRQGTASGLRLKMTDGTNTFTSATSATTGSFVTLTLTATLAAGTTTLICYIEALSTGTYYVDNAMLVIGPAPAPYQPLHPQEDLARCQRYYEVHGGVNDEFPDIAGSATAGALSFRSSYPWSVPKGGIPTVTKNGTWAVLNCGQPTVTSATPSGYAIQCVSTAGGQYATNPNSTDDVITGEWNP